MENWEKELLGVNAIRQQNIDLFEKSITEDINKGKRAEVGEIRTWSGKKYQKTKDGWVPVKDKGQKESSPGNHKPGDTIEHNGKKFKKQSNGKWLEVSEHGMTHGEHKDKEKEHWSSFERETRYSPNPSSKSSIKRQEKIEAEAYKHQDAANSLSDKEHTDEEVGLGKKKEDREKIFSPTDKVELLTYGKNRMIEVNPSDKLKNTGQVVEHEGESYSVFEGSNKKVLVKQKDIDTIFPEKVSGGNDAKFMYVDKHISDITDALKRATSDEQRNFLSKELGDLLKIKNISNYNQEDYKMLLDLYTREVSQGKEGRVIDAMAEKLRQLKTDNSSEKKGGEKESR